MRAFAFYGSQKKAYICFCIVAEMVCITSGDSIGIANMRIFYAMSTTKAFWLLQ